MHFEKMTFILNDKKKNVCLKFLLYEGHLQIARTESYTEYLIFD